MRESMKEGETVAFAHVDNVSFPEPRGLTYNMMPFVMGDKGTLPEELHGYWKLIQRCVKTLVGKDSKSSVGYLTVHESVVREGTSQRRPGLHTEGFRQTPFGNVETLPRWHPWGFGHSMGAGWFDGGIFIASNVNDSCHVYNTVVPEQLVGAGGDVEYLRPVLDEHFPNSPKPRTRWPNEPGRYYEHAGCARLDAHMEPDEQGCPKPTRRPISMQAGELIWMTDRTPHESMPLPTDQPRQFFRLVSGGIDTWFAAHSTPNPLGVEPQAHVVTYDKFTGEHATGPATDHGASAFPAQASSPNLEPPAPTLEQLRVS